MARYRAFIKRYRSKLEDSRFSRLNIEERGLLGLIVRGGVLIVIKASKKRSINVKVDLIALRLIERLIAAFERVTSFRVLQVHVDRAGCSRGGIARCCGMHSRVIDLCRLEARSRVQDSTKSYSRAAGV